ncbi:D-alanyl-D-alanine carboxypeptidase family protein [Demequina sp. SO4-18]|uniref:D-alanyl-D-alanine carboxypeptidase family protein n=1 Tax=Demequina sp. SO4-18 TaxID=3401026 RepID=UPI003B59491A
MPIIPEGHRAQLARGTCNSKGGPRIHTRSHGTRIVATRTATVVALGAALALLVTPAQAQVESPGSTTSPAPSSTPTSTLSATDEPAAAPATTTTASPSPTTSPTPATSPAPSPAPSSPSPLPQELPSGEAPPADDPDAATDAPSTDFGITASAGPRIQFVDVSSRVGDAKYSEFAAEIAWLAESGLSEGWLRSDGLREFRPYSNVSRDAMAAFLYRFAASPAHVPPARSPFVDILPTSTEFYSEITWAADAGISTGWKVSGGSAYRPFTPITREAMAAFLYRYAGSPRVSLPGSSPFIDVSPTSPFYEAMVWLEATGAANGWQTANGPEFRPRATITRDAMAAFVQRLDSMGVAFTPTDKSTPLLRHSVMYVYGADTLNIRSGPSTSHPVVTRRTRDSALNTTGAVSADGWIEVLIGGDRAWASGYYLIGTGGAAITQARSTYSNGRIPESHLCALSWDSSEILLCQAAEDLERLNLAFRNRYGINIPVNDTYRDYDAQVRAKELYGYLAATPGTSNHGWAAAVDIGGSRLPGGYQGSAYLWLRQQLAGYNWVLPTWARPSGSKPEPWHFEYTG